MVHISDLFIGFDQRSILSGINLNLKEGEILGVLGKSGCGKTSLLRSLAGLQPIKSGRIKLDGECLNEGETIQLPPHQRQVGLMFQDYALFPHLTIAENIGFGLSELSKVDRENRVSELLEMIQLPELASRYPHELSGGQQQRVALARALAPNPKLLLLDEPFSNLDNELRQDLAKSTRDLLKQNKTTAILVTHDQQDAEILCDQFGWLQNDHFNYSIN